MKHTKDEITGTLSGWVVQEVGKNQCIVYGNIYGDKKGRFPDGFWIHTSLVDGCNFKEGDLVVTLNSTYKLGKPMKARKIT